MPKNKEKPPKISFLNVLPAVRTSFINPALRACVTV
jgi:hypothetical protein